MDKSPPSESVLRSVQVVQFLCRYPLLIWVLSLSILLLIGGIGANFLLSPGRIESTQPRVTPPSPQKVLPEVTSPAVNASEELSVWLFGAIAVSCIGGCLILAQYLEAPRPMRKYSKSVKQPAQVGLPQRAIANHLSPQPLPSSPQFRAANRRTATKQKGSPLPVSHASARRMSVSSRATKPRTTSPVVTIVPPEESHPLDWSEANLAELMDVRKRRNLSSLF